MASYAGNLGPVGAQSNRPLVDQGTLARFASPLPGALGRDDDRQLFESAYDLLRAEIAKIVSETVESGVRSSFSAMQAAQTVAQLPMVAPSQMYSSKTLDGRRRHHPGWTQRYRSPKSPCPCSPIWPRRATLRRRRQPTPGVRRKA